MVSAASSFLSLSENIPLTPDPSSPQSCRNDRQIMLSLFNPLPRPVDKYAGCESDLSSWLDLIQ